MLQIQALHVMKRGDSVFLTGPAGSGKTYVLNQLIKNFKKQKKQMAITASTGIAATHIGGTTIHSWSGLGIRDSLTEQDRVWLKNNDRLTKRYNGTDVLIIDEVSMLHGKRLDMVNEACKLLRKSDEPFGGLQVILTGDLFQLPPVNREGGPDDFAHLSAAWNELDPKICYLTEQHRQQGDALLDLLCAMRDGELNADHHAALTVRIGMNPDEDTAVTRLYAHNVDVESINERHLKALDGESHIYEMVKKGRTKNVEQLQKSVLAPEVLELKKGAEVMFVANNFAQGFVNGSRGKVVDFANDDAPIVELQTGGKRIEVEPHSWTLSEDGREKARLSQLPLRLAWAITIHKSQGMSLDGAQIDLSRSFAYGMGYVALSRVRSFDGLYLSGINHTALQLHPDIYEFDARLREASHLLAEEVGVVIEQAEAETDESFENDVDEALFEHLKQWRLEKSRSQGMPAYVIAHNKTLEALATRKPQSEHALLSCHGIGKKFMEAYGQDVLEIIGQYAPKKPAEESELPETNVSSESTSELDRETIIARYPRAYKRWQPEEEGKLIELINEGALFSDICDTLQRQPNGVWARAVKLLESSNNLVAK